MNLCFVNKFFRIISNIVGGGEGWGEGIVKEFGMDIYTLLYLKWITNKHVELCSMLCGSLDGKGVWGRMDTYICMAESLHPPQTITTLLIGYITIQNKKLKKITSRVCTL